MVATNSRHRRVLITGADGFIGSHCVDHLLATTDWDLVLICSWSHGGMHSRLGTSEHVRRHRGRVTVITHDLRGPIDDVGAFQIGDDCDAVIHFAADSHVDRSLDAPVPFVMNNVAVTLNLLEWARRQKALRAFVQISTDEVYGPAGTGEAHAEWSPIIPSNPYAASKAAQEAIACSYWRAYGVPVIVTTTMNNVGEKQHPEKFLPKIIRHLMRGEPVPVHAVEWVKEWPAGSGRPPELRRTVGSRFYLHARNHADACRWLIERGDVSAYPAPGRDGPFADRPDRWNVVGDVELGNDELVRMVGRIMLNMDWTGMLHRPERLLTMGWNADDAVLYVDAHSARPGHDLRYALDGRKLAAAGWVPPVPFEESLRRTVEWYCRNPEWLLMDAAK